LVKTQSERTVACHLYDGATPQNNGSAEEDVT
jgi:hypothetical protein